MPKKKNKKQTPIDQSAGEQPGELIRHQPPRKRSKKNGAAAMQISYPTSTPRQLCKSKYKICRDYYPFYYFAGRVCLDCINNRKLIEDSRRRREGLIAGMRADDIPEPDHHDSIADEDVRAADLTPAAAALAELEARGLPLSETALPSENEDDLVAEIAHARATGNVVETFDDGTARDARPYPSRRSENR